MIRSGVSDESKPSSKFDLAFFVFEVCFLIGIFLSPFLFGSVDMWAFSVCIFLMVLPALIYWVSFLHTGGGVYRTPLNKPILVYVVLFAVSGFFSKLPYPSLVEFYKLISIIAIFHATLLYCRDRKHTYRLAQVIVLTGTALSVIGILQLLGGMPKDWWHMPNYLSSTYVNHNHFAGLLVIVIPMALGIVFAERESAKKVLFGFMGVVMIVAFVFTISRGGLAGFGAAVLFMVLTLKSQKLVREGSPFIIMALIAVAGVIMFGTNPIEQRFQDIQNMTRPEELSLHMRLLTWQGTLNMLPHSFLLGTGPGTFGQLFLQYRPIGSSIRPVYTHNDYLNLLTDCGIFVFLATAWVIWAIFRHGYMLSRKDESRMRMGLGAASMAGIFGLLVHGFFDFNFHIPANWLMASVAAGILFSLDNDQFYPTNDKKLPLYKGVVVGISLIAIVGSVFFGTSDYYYWSSKSLFKQKAKKEALQSIQTSLLINPFNAESHYMKGFINRSMSKTDIKSPASGSDEQTIKSFEKAIQLNPYEPMYDFMSARMKSKSLSKNDPSKLIELYEKALAKDPRNPVLLVMAVKDLLSADPKINSDIRLVAKDWLKKAIGMDPDLSEISYELLWRHEKNVASILSFYQSTPTGLKGLVSFLEKNDLWKQHRKYFLKMHGIDPDTQKKKLLSGVWNEKSPEILALKDFLPQEGEQVNYDEFFYESGQLSKNVNFHNSYMRLVLNAKSSIARNTYPVLHIRVDDEIQDSLYLDSKEFKNYYVLLYTTPGFHRLTLEYVNDTQDKRAGTDRNIWIKKIELQDSTSS